MQFLQQDFKLLLDQAGNGFLVAARIDQPDARRFHLGQMEKAVAYPLVKFASLAFKPVGLPFFHSFCCYRGIKIKKKGRLGDKPACGDHVELAEDGEILAAAISLVGQGRVGMPVKNDDLTPGKGRPDPLINMLGPVCGEEKRFSKRAGWAV